MRLIVSPKIAMDKDLIKRAYIATLHEPDVVTLTVQGLMFHAEDRERRLRLAIKTMDLLGYELTDLSGGLIWAVTFTKGAGKVTNET